MTKRTPLLLSVLSFCVLFATPIARADEDSEREQLAKIDYELERVLAMAADAARQAPTGQRIRFRYDWLQRDLALMRQGIAEHLDAPRQPRPVPPLRGEYRQ